MKRILITRPEPGASQTAARLSDLGFLPLIGSVFTIKSNLIQAPSQVLATILTSGSAVPACPPTLFDRPVFAVGTATACRATEAGFKTVINADGDAQVLASLVIKQLSPGAGTLLFPAGRGQGSSLAKNLRSNGFRVIRRVAYQTSAIEGLPPKVETALRQREIAVAMFYSGETSRQFVQLLQAAGLTDTVRDVEAVSISHRASVALRSLPWRLISVAEKPNQDAMLALLQ